MSKIIVRDKLQTIPLHSLTPYVMEKNSNLGNHGLEIVSQRDQVRLLREAKKNHLKNDVQALFKDLKQISLSRVELLFRDVQFIYNRNAKIIKDLLGYSNAQTFWESIWKQNTHTQQKGQIEFLSKIFVSLQRMELIAGDSQQIKEFEEIKETLKWFTYAVAEHEIYLRRIIVNSHEMEIANKRKKRIIEFEKDEQKAKKEFQEKEIVKRQEIARLNKQKTDELVANLSNRSIHQKSKVTPTLQLRQAKQKKLLDKLSPYKWQALRQQEHRRNQQELSHTMELHNKKLISAMKKFTDVEIHKENRRQALKAKQLQISSQSKKEEMALRFSHLKQHLDKYQNARQSRLQHQSTRLTNNKVISLKKSFNSFHQRAESDKIREIIRANDLKFILENNGNEARKEDISAGEMTTNYRMLAIGDRYNQQREEFDDNYSKEKHIMSSFAQYSDNGLKRLTSTRKSLTDLYDDHMNLIA